MMQKQIQPIYRADDNELLGYVSKDKDTWRALTIFGAPFFEGSKVAAIQEVQSKGLQILADKWEYLDEATGEWQQCMIIEASKDNVKIAPFDGFYPDISKSHRIKATLLRKK
jgi:hypothetical protein